MNDRIRECHKFMKDNIFKVAVKEGGVVIVLLYSTRELSRFYVWTDGVVTLSGSTQTIYERWKVTEIEAAVRMIATEAKLTHEN